MGLLLSSPEDLKKLVEEKNAPELFEYLRMGGILRLKREGDKVVVTYPTKNMIDSKIRELEERKRRVVKELASLRRIKRGRRLLDPLRIRHSILKIVDREYRDIAQTIEIHRLLDDARGRKIVEQLQKNKEYRKRLLEALKSSPVYRTSRFGSFVEKAEHVKSMLLGERMEDLERAIERINREISVLKKLRSWVR